MKKTFMLTILVLFFSCKEKVTQVDDTLNIQFTLLNGMLWADFRNVATPENDNVCCEFTVVIKNLSETIGLQEAKIPELRVFWTESMQSIGKVQLSATWDGYVSAGETDTVYLVKKPYQGPTLDTIPCNSLVTYNITLIKQEQIVGEIKRDSVLFTCYY